MPRSNARHEQGVSASAGPSAQAARLPGLSLRTGVKQRLGIWSTADLDRWNEQTIDLYLRRRTWLDVEKQLKRPGRTRQGRRRLGWAPLKSLIFLPEVADNPVCHEGCASAVASYLLRHLDPGRVEDDCVEVEWLLRKGLPAELPEREGLKVYKVPDSDPREELRGGWGLMLEGGSPLLDKDEIVGFYGGVASFQRELQQLELKDARRQRTKLQLDKYSADAQLDGNVGKLFGWKDAFGFDPEQENEWRCAVCVSAAEQGGNELAFTNDPNLDPFGSDYNAHVVGGGANCTLRIVMLGPLPFMAMFTTREVDPEQAGVSLEMNYGASYWQIIKERQEDAKAEAERERRAKNAAKAKRAAEDNVEQLRREQEETRRQMEEMRRQLEALQAQSEQPRHSCSNLPLPGSLASGGQSGDRTAAGASACGGGSGRAAPDRPPQQEAGHGRSGGGCCGGKQCAAASAKQAPSSAAIATTSACGSAGSGVARTGSAAGRPASAQDSQGEREAAGATSSARGGEASLSCTPQPPQQPEQAQGVGSAANQGAAKPSAPSSRFKAQVALTQQQRRSLSTTRPLLQPLKRKADPWLHARRQGLNSSSNREPGGGQGPQGAPQRALSRLGQQGEQSAAGGRQEQRVQAPAAARQQPKPPLQAEVHSSQEQLGKRGAAARQEERPQLVAQQPQQQPEAQAALQLPEALPAAGGTGSAEPQCSSPAAAAEQVQQEATASTPCTLARAGSPAPASAALAASGGRRRRVTSRRTQEWHALQRRLSVGEAAAPCSSAAEAAEAGQGELQGSTQQALDTSDAPSTGSSPARSSGSSTPGPSSASSAEQQAPEAAGCSGRVAEWHVSDSEEEEEPWVPAGEPLRWAGSNGMGAGEHAAAAAPPELQLAAAEGQQAQRAEATDWERVHCEAVEGAAQQQNRASCGASDRRPQPTAQVDPPPGEPAAAQAASSGAAPAAAPAGAGDGPEVIDLTGDDSPGPAPQPQPRPQRERPSHQRGPDTAVPASGEVISLLDDD